MDHFAPRVSPCMAVFVYHRRKQEADETVDEYQMALRILVMDCRFSGQAERNMMLLAVGGGVRQQEDTAAGTFGDGTAHVGSCAGCHAGE